MVASTELHCAAIRRTTKNRTDAMLTNIGDWLCDYSHDDAAAVLAELHTRLHEVVLPPEEEPDPTDDEEWDYGGEALTAHERNGGRLTGAMA